jgi:hypothetical protein
MRREAHSHGAYQDFVREVGAPNLLLTDNAKTQIGVKWKKTSRDNITKQVATVPHNQQQNQAERKIRDMKARVLLTLRKSHAPLAFWCYCLQWVADCLNHTAHQHLDWRTPQERLNGMTPDISAFRFTFFEPVWYYEPTAKYPEPNFLPGRFVGIAWNHGDALTYRIWTCPSGRSIADGQELIRNIVKSRNENATATDLPAYILEFERGQRSRKRKRSKKTTTDARVETTEVDALDDRPPLQSQSPMLNAGDDRHVSFQLNSSTNPAPIFSNESKIQEEPGGRKHNDTTTTISKQLENTTELLESSIGTEMVNEVNDELAEDHTEATKIGGASVAMIEAHRWKSGQLQFRVIWNTEQPSWEDYRLLKVDHPQMTARYIVANYVTRSTRHGADRTLQWASKTLRDIKRAIRRIGYLYDHHLDDNDNIYHVRRAGVKTKKRKKQRPTEQLKYGVAVPRNVAQAYEFDRRNGDNAWHDAIKAEIDSLIKLECFEFHPTGHNPGLDYQWTSLTIIFDVKQDLRRKARLVAGGHLVDSLDNNVYSSTVKGISVRVLHVIAHKMKLKLFCGDVGNAYNNAYTNELVYSKCGKEFGPDLEGKTVIIRKALYGLRTRAVVEPFC